jgi:hypothetical protein
VDLAKGAGMDRLRSFYLKRARLLRQAASEECDVERRDALIEIAKIFEDRYLRSSPQDGDGH